MRDDEPTGIMTQLGVSVHWTTPYSGQSKPIERAFRDFAQGLAKHPHFAGAYVGNSPVNKPENYGSKAVDYQTFVEVVSAGILSHNARPGRRSCVCAGKSFRMAFDASYENSPIQKATAEQQRLWLLVGETLLANRRDGTVEIEGNRYWSSELLEFRGQRVTVRFDPDDLHDDVHTYRTDGVYVGPAKVVAAVGFNSASAAREHAGKRKAFVRANKVRLEVEREISIAEYQRLLPAGKEPDEPPEAKPAASRR